MSRPKESKFGLLSGAVSLYSANKVRKLGKEFDGLSDSLNSLNSGLGANLVAIKTVADLQVATMSGVYQLNLELERVSESQWELYKFFEDRHQEQERLGDLKLLLRNIKKEVEKIKQLSENYLEYATYMAEQLKETFESLDVRIEHFKRLSVQEIDWAEEIIDSVGYLYSSLYSKLGD
jgi:hypothetical protein